MTAQELEMGADRLSRWGRSIRAAARNSTMFLASVVGASARPVREHLTAHAYSIAGCAFIDAAAFVHSLFTGLLVTGISFFAFEWKVQPDDE